MTVRDVTVRARCSPVKTMAVPVTGTACSPKPAPHPQPRKPAAARKFTAFWKVETAEEKLARLEKDGREYAERAEQVRLREIDAKRKKDARARVKANERMQRHHPALIARVCLFFH